MLALLAAALALPVSHLGLSAEPIRSALVARLGEGRFRALYSLVALAALVALIAACAAAERVPAPAVPGAAGAAPPITLSAFILVAAGYLGPKPTGAGFQNQLYRVLGRPRGVLRLTRHPIQSGVALWAAVHLAAVGELGGILFFASLLVLAVGGTAHLEARLARRYRAAWPAFAAATGVVPGAAILAGRQRLEPAEIGWLALLTGVAAWGVFWGAHAWLFGVPG